MRAMLQLWLFAALPLAAAPDSLHALSQSPDSDVMRWFLIDQREPSTLDDFIPGRALRVPDATGSFQIGRVTLVEQPAERQLTLTGKLENGLGWFVLAVDQNHVRGAAWTHGHAVEFSVDPPPLGRRVRVIDSADCTCESSRLPQIKAQDAAEFTPPLSAVGGCPVVVDVLVLYTAAARQSAGGEAPIRAIAAASMASANLALLNSGVPLRLRLAHLDVVDEPEAGDFLTDLMRLQADGDGFYDIAHPLREHHHADLVSLLVGTVTGSCGIAYTMSTPTPTFAHLAFSVVQLNCALSNLSFAHELAHNMGCAHHHGEGNIGAFPFAHGHRFVGMGGTTWRTVMAGSSGFRIPYFSNPDVAFDGVAVGVAIDQPLAAHNALALAQTSPVVEMFREGAMVDCNANGMADACDIASGFSSDLNDNTIPDECDGPPCAFDADAAVAPPDLQPFDRFGSSVSLAQNRLIAGAEQDDDAGTLSGSATVFRHDGARWVREAKLLAADGAPFDRFGHAAVLSPDEVWALVGAYREGDVLSDTGAVYFFRRDGDTWTQTQRIINPDPAQADWFGWAVAFCGTTGDGLRAVVASPFDDQGAIDAGAFYAYRLEQGQWQFESKIVAKTPISGARLGFALAASAGTRVIAGAPFEDGPAPDTGSATIFRRDGASWFEEDRLEPPSGAEGDRFGAAVAMTDAHVLVGAPGRDGAAENAGAVFCYDRLGLRWIPVNELEAPDAALGANFGAALAINHVSAVVGSPLGRSAGVACGAAYLLHRDDLAWQHQAKFNPVDGAANDQIGAAVAISSDATLAAIASPWDDHGPTLDGGTVRLFSLELNQPDCNGNGLPDACDVSSATSRDVNLNGVPDECEPVDPNDCIADIDGNGSVDLDDLRTVLSMWGACASDPPMLCAADVHPVGTVIGDGVVNVNDLLAVINAWGPCP